MGRAYQWAGLGLAIGILLTPQAGWPQTPVAATSQSQPPGPAAIDHPIRLELRLSLRKLVIVKDDTWIRVYPVAIGRPGWETPKGEFKVLQMTRNPTWIHPLTGEVVSGGDPENPLGKYWIGFWTNGTNWVGFHGTPNPESVGRPASHGCVRMYNQDIEELFQRVTIGTPVRVVW